MNVRGRVPKDGKWVKADNIDIGEPLLYTVEEWGDRMEREWRRATIRGMALFVFLVFPLLAAFLMEAIGWLNSLAISAAVILIFPAVMIILLWMMKRRADQLGLHGGLYTNGIVSIASVGLPVVFLPYLLIEEIKTPRVNFFNRMLTLKIKGFKLPISFELRGVLGEEGIKTLRYMMSKGPEPQGPPELHIYGGRGARIRSIPRNSGKKGSED